MRHFESKYKSELKYTAILHARLSNMAQLSSSVGNICNYESDKNCASCIFNKVSLELQGSFTPIVLQVQQTEALDSMVTLVYRQNSSIFFSFLPQGRGKTKTYWLTGRKEVTNTSSCSSQKRPDR